MVLDSYPNKTKYSSTGAAAALYNLYNGSFSLTVNNRVITPSWNAYQHLYVPQTQNGTGVTAQTVFPIDQFEGSTSGSLAVEPNWVLIGSKNNNFTLNLPSAVSALQGTGTTTTTVVVILRGVLAQNSTVVS
jgi:hypothetical protein